MREDMAKVVTERPRTNRAWTYGNFRSKENRGNMDDLPVKQGMRRPYQYGYDEYSRNFTDLINPLFRYLKGCVGRKWDDVWSEICTNLRPDSTTQQHIRDHVISYVETHVVFDEKTGKCYESRAQFSYPGDRIWVEVTGLYVDPRDGILRDNIRKRYVSGKERRAKEIAKVFKKIGPELEAYKIKGVWYWAVFATVPAPIPRKIFDRKTNEIITVYTNTIRHDLEVFSPDNLAGYVIKDRKSYKSGERYRASKRQLSHRELKKYGLINN